MSSKETFNTKFTDLKDDIREIPNRFLNNWNFIRTVGAGVYASTSELMIAEIHNPLIRQAIVVSQIAVVTYFATKNAEVEEEYEIIMQDNVIMEQEISDLRSASDGLQENIIQFPLFPED